MAWLIDDSIDSCDRGRYGDYATPIQSNETWLIHSIPLESSPLRKLTRAIAETLQPQLQAHLTVLSPLMQPRLVFGRLCSSSKQAVKGEDATFKQVQELYSGLIGKGPFHRLPEALDTPLDIVSTSPVIAPAEYRHVARTDQVEKTITMSRRLNGSQRTRDLKWNGYAI